MGPRQWVQDQDSIHQDQDETKTVKYCLKVSEGQMVSRDFPDRVLGVKQYQYVYWIAGCNNV